MEGSGGRKVLIVVVFALLIGAAALVSASGASRFALSEVERPGLLWLGAGLFAVAAVIGLIARAVRPEWQHSGGLTAGGMAVVMVMFGLAMLVALVSLFL
jgi:hypothetical protein